MQWAFTLPGLCKPRGAGILQRRQRGRYGALFRRKRFVKTRLATTGYVAMNDPTLGRLIDCRNRHANLIGGGC